VKITYNGQRYSSLEALPPEARRLFAEMTSHWADRNGNGIPDVFETDATDREITLTSDRKIVVNERTYSNVDELPPADREMLQQIRGLFDRMLDGEPGKATTVTIDLGETARSSLESSRTIRSGYYEGQPPPGEFPPFGRSSHDASRPDHLDRRPWGESLWGEPSLRPFLTVRLIERCIKLAVGVGMLILVWYFTARYLGDLKQLLDLPE
jgi:hypothetical protein